MTRFITSCSIKSILFSFDFEPFPKFVPTEEIVPSTWVNTCSESNEICTDAQDGSLVYHPYFNYDNDPFITTFTEQDTSSITTISGARLDFKWFSYGTASMKVEIEINGIYEELDSSFNPTGPPSVINSFDLDTTNWDISTIENFKVKLTPATLGNTFGVDAIELEIYQIPNRDSYLDGQFTINPEKNEYSWNHETIPQLNHINGYSINTGFGTGHHIDTSGPGASQSSYDFLGMTSEPVKSSSSGALNVEGWFKQTDKLSYLPDSEHSYSLDYFFSPIIGDPDTINTDCVNGNCIAFDGVEDAVNFGIGQASPTNVQEKATISIWFKTSYGGQQTIISQASGSQNGRGISLDAGGIYVWSRDSSFAEKKLLLGLYDDGWIHVALVQDGSILKGYVNGALIGSINMGSYLISYTDFWGLGSLFDSPHFQGQLDVLKIFDTPLTDNQIRNLYLKVWERKIDLDIMDNSFQKTDDPLIIDNDCISGSCLDLDWNDAVTIGIESEISKLQELNTISLWFKARDTLNHQSIISQGAYLGTIFNESRGLFIENDHLFGWSRNAAGSKIEIDLGFISNSEWHHVLFGQRLMILWGAVDGQSTTFSSMSGFQTHYSNHWELGGYTHTTGYNFNGIIDQIHLYKQPLGEYQALPLYQWEIDRGLEYTIFDTSLNLIKKGDILQGSEGLNKWIFKEIEINGLQSETNYYLGIGRNDYSTEDLELGAEWVVKTISGSANDPNNPLRPYTIEGFLIDSIGNPLVGKSITATDTTTSDVYSGITDFNGQFLINTTKYHSELELEFPGDLNHDPSSTVIDSSLIDEIAFNFGPKEYTREQNFKKMLLKNFVAKSGAFMYDPATNNYTMTKDRSLTWEVPLDTNLDNRSDSKSINGYELYSSSIAVEISANEIETSRFDSQLIKIKRHYVLCDASSCTPAYETHNLLKEDFLTLWLNVQLHEWHVEDNPPIPGTFTDLDNYITTYFQEVDNGASTPLNTDYARYWVHVAISGGILLYLAAAALLSQLPSYSSAPNSDESPTSTVNHYEHLNHVYRSTDNTDTSPDPGSSGSVNMAPIPSFVFVSMFQLVNFEQLYGSIELFVQEVVNFAYALLYQDVIEIAKSFYEPLNDPELIGISVTDGVIASVNRILDPNKQNFDDISNIISQIIAAVLLRRLIIDIFDYLLKSRVGELDLELFGAYGVHFNFDPKTYELGTVSTNDPTPVVETAFMVTLTLSGLSVTLALGIVTTSGLTIPRNFIESVFNLITGTSDPGNEFWGMFTTALYFTQLGIPVDIFDELYRPLLGSLIRPDFMIFDTSNPIFDRVFFEAKGTRGGLGNIRAHLTLAHEQIKGGILAFSPLLTDPFEEWGGISCWDASNRVLIVMWLNT